MSDNDFTFSQTQREQLAVVLDRIIPASERHGLPGAAEVGLVDFIENALRANPAHQLGVVPGLDTFAELVGGGAALDDAFEQIQSREPGFVPTVVFLTYAGYYQSHRVQEALGLEPRPPHPKGYEMDRFDPSLLDKVRQRGKIYRDA